MIDLRDKLDAFAVGLPESTRAVPAGLQGASLLSDGMDQQHAPESPDEKMRAAAKAAAAAKVLAQSVVAGTPPATKLARPRPASVHAGSVRTLLGKAVRSSYLAPALTMAR